MSETVTLARASFGALFEVLEHRGYICVGPTVRDGAVVYDRVRRCEDLPVGWVDEQGPGHYRLTRNDEPTLFGCVVGPHSFKKYLFPAQQRLWQISRSVDGFTRCDEPTPAPRYAFLGVRACEIAAIRVQDRVFMGGSFTDPSYRERRQEALIIAVSCIRSAATCFCVSMGTGPEVTSGHDLALTELVDGGHRFVIRAGSERGRSILAELAVEPARRGDVETARSAVEACAAQQTRSLDTEGLPALLRESRESPQWDEVAQRCLACANCTMACPTCFCSSVEDVSDLSGQHAERWRRWDSCFNPEFSYLHGGEVRRTTAARYRQWISHKLGTWFDQFGTSGCVGCGRCIAWCPVGIDITEEVRRLRQTKAGGQAA